MTTSTGVPGVAVCIPTFNQARYVEGSVRSALAQKWPHVEVWVSDDASTDRTPEILAGIEDRRVHVIRQTRNLGIAGNTSLVLSQPTTPYVVRLDSDDLLHPNYLSTLIPFMEQHPTAGYGHTAVAEINEHGEFQVVRGLRRRTGFKDSRAALRDALTGYRTAANILTFRKAALEQVHYVNGRPDFVEDYDLSIRLADAGWGNVYVDTVLASYRAWSDADRAKAQRQALQLDGYARIFDEALTPAWRRRGWNDRDLVTQRRRLAAGRVASCFEKHYTAEESQRLVDLVLRISSAPMVSTRIWLARHGLAPALRAWARARGAPRQTVKRVLVSIKTSHP